MLRNGVYSSTCDRDVERAAGLWAWTSGNGAHPSAVPERLKE